MNEVDDTVTDLAKKHQGILENQDDGEVVTGSFALDRQNMEILRSKIMAILIDEIKPKKSNQTKLV